MPCLDELGALAIFDAKADTAQLAELSTHLDACSYCRALVAAIGRADGDAPTDLASLTVLEPGTRIGKFVVERELGAGASGAVYAVRDPELDREVALKLLHYRGAASSPEHEELLLREARAMAKLSHPNLVPVYEVGRWEGSVFVAMELVAGGTLRDWLTTSKRGPTLELMIGAGRGLAAAHDAGLVHRDLKPENILVGGDGRARVTDFGLAQVTPSLANDAVVTTTLVTQTGALVGTPAYMAPEQLRATAADARSDQFSFCVVLYEALFGTRPFTGGTIAELAAAITSPPPPRSGAPRRVWSALVTGLHPDPERRFRDMHALLDALQPRAHRRVAFAAVGVALAAAGAAFALRPHHSDTCAPVAVDEWSPAAAARVRDAFDATRSPIAGATYERVAQALDRYATAWTAMRTDACTATRVRGDASDALLDHRTRCLDDARAELAALIGQLESATADVVEKAPTAIAALPAPAACLTPDSDEDPVTTPEATVLRDRLHRASALASFSATVAPELDSIIARADTLRMPRLRAEAIFERGLLRMNARDGVGSVADLEEAAYGAEANKLDRLAARAGAAAITAATDAGDLERARRWLRPADAAVARLGPDDPERSDLASRRSWFELHTGDLQAAEADARAAAAHGCRDPKAKTSSCAYDDALGTVLVTAGKYAEALDVYRENVALVEADYGPAHPKTARVIERVATTLEKLGRHAEALAQYDRAIAILGEDNTATAALLYANSATALMKLGKLDEASARSKRALAIHEKLQGPDHPEVASSLVNLANILELAGKTDDVLAMRERALHIFETKLGPDHPMVAASLVSIGWHYVSAKQPAAAVPYLERAIAIDAAKLGTSHPEYAYALSVLGSAQLDSHHPADAAATLQRAIDCPGTSAAELPDLKFNLADALWQSHGDHAKARALVVAANKAKPDPEYARWLKTH